MSRSRFAGLHLDAKLICLISISLSPLSSTTDFDGQIRTIQLASHWATF